MKEGINLKKWIAIICLGLLMLSGCGVSGQNNNEEEAELPEIIEAVLAVPEKADIGEEVPLTVTVSQGKEAVEDANEVKFEIWLEGKKDGSVLVEAKHTEKGKYEAVYSFPENGLFHVQSHVTARDMHTMPTKQIQIGEAAASHDDHQASESDHHHHGDVIMHLQKPESLQANQSVALTVKVEKEQEPLVKANVRLEIFQKGNNPAWVTMTEAENGEYKANYSFPNSGAFIIRIHVENDEGLHEHTEEEVTVK